MMPHLPGADLKLDLKGFKKLFEDPRFMPDSSEDLSYPGHLEKALGSRKY